VDLKKRFEKFKESEFELNKDFYSELKDEQKPHTLFIGCSDSRVNAETLFGAKTGEIFQIRNVANIVPSKDKADENYAVVSALEYAVKILKVKNIIVGGHSNCGGCAAIRKFAEYKNTLPYTTEWISQSVFISDYVDSKYPNMKEEDKLVLLEKFNAIGQLNNLMTYDFVKEKVEAGEINLQACYYDIGTGDIVLYDYEGVSFDRNEDNI